jgi:hypothetical protein
LDQISTFTLPATHPAMTLSMPDGAWRLRTFPIASAAEAAGTISDQGRGCRECSVPDELVLSRVPSTVQTPGSGREDSGTQN